MPMSAHRHVPLWQRAEAPWLALCSLLAAGALLAGWLPSHQLDWRAPLAVSQPWRHLSAVWVHLGAAHLWANLAGLAVVAAFGRAAGCLPRDALAWLCAWPLTHVLLLLQPELQRYAGMSGVLHAGVAVASFGLIARRRGAPRVIGALVMTGLLLKLLSEDPLTSAVQEVSGWGFPVAVWAHATGTAAGLLCAGVAWVTTRRPSVATMA